MLWSLWVGGYNTLYGVIVSRTSSEVGEGHGGDDTTRSAANAEDAGGDVISRGDEGGVERVPRDKGSGSHRRLVKVEDVRGEATFVSGHIVGHCDRRASLLRDKRGFREG